MSPKHAFHRSAAMPRMGVHQDNARAQSGIESIVNLCAIKPGDKRFWEETLQQRMPILGPFVEQKLRA